RIDRLTARVKVLEEGNPAALFDQIFRGMLTIIPPSVPDRWFYASVAAHKAVTPVSAVKLSEIMQVDRRRISDAIDWLERNILPFESDEDALAYLTTELA